MFLVSADFAIHISCHIPFFEHLFLLKDLSTSCESDAYLDKISFAIDLGRDEGKSFFFHLSSEIINIFFLQEYFSVCCWIHPEFMGQVCVG